MAYAQPNTQAGEELAQLFSRNMTLQQPQQISQPQPSQQSSEPEPIKYSITQHYHHSSHIVHYDSPTSEPQHTSSEHQDASSSSVEQVLKNHGIDPSCLSPDQIELFKTGDTPQQIRLIQLWHICPPYRTSQATPWMDTEVSEDARRDSVMSLDGTPLTPVQTTEGHWVNMTTYVEPYMMSGYEMLARREYEQSSANDVDMTGPPPKEQEHFTPFGSNHDNYRPATDPAYAAAMENQYGIYQQSGGMQF